MACYITHHDSTKTHTKPSLVLLWHVVYDGTYHDVRVRVCAREREKERVGEREHREAHLVTAWHVIVALSRA